MGTNLLNLLTDKELAVKLIDAIETQDLQLLKRVKAEMTRRRREE